MAFGKKAYSPAHRLPSGWGKLWAALGLGIASYLVLIAAEVVGVLAMQATEVDFNVVMASCELIAGAFALLFVFLLGGKHIARPQMAGMGEAWVAALWLFGANGIFVAIEIAGVALGTTSIDIAPDWPLRTLVLALLCIGVGLLEESTMRGLCLNGLLVRMGRTRGGVYGAIIISSLLFGLMHIDPLSGFDDPLLIGQNLMKALQTGMCGFLFAAILVKTRNLWAVISIHAANDFMLLFMSSALTANPVSTDYAQAGDQGAALLMVYVILCVLYLPFLLIGKRLIDQASPWRGDFYHYRASTLIAPANTAIPAAQPVPAPVLAAERPDAPMPTSPVSTPYVTDSPAVSTRPQESPEGMQHEEIRP